MTDTNDPNALRLPAFLRAVPGTLMARVIAGRTEDNPSYGLPLLAMLEADIEPISLNPGIELLAEMLVDVVLSYDVEGYHHWRKVVETFTEPRERVPTLLPMREPTILLPMMRRVMPDLIAPMNRSFEFGSSRSYYPHARLGKLRISRETGNIVIYTGYRWTPMGSTDRRRLWANIRMKLADMVEVPFYSEMARLAERTFLNVVKQIMPNAVHLEACEEFKREMEVVE